MWLEGDVNEPTQLEEALALALQLAPRDRLRLVEHVVASVGHVFAAQESQDAASTHWGQQLDGLLDTLDLSEWESIDDPVEWIRLQRTKQDSRRQPYWDEME